MKTAFLIIFALFGLIQTQNCDRKTMPNTETNIVVTPTATPKKMTKYDRLPENITLETEVRKDVKNKKGEVISSETTTVEKRLNELKASYKNDKLIDGKGKEIRFFEPLCRGMSAGFEQDEIDRKAKDKELADLEKKYTVIVLLCDPGKVM
ncbi:MAG: hypothetical protein ABWZ66_12000 [Pyrinomonadaceae bacterium]